MNDRLFCQIPRPKIGIRVVVDGRCNGVREKIEAPTFALAQKSQRASGEPRFSCRWTTLGMRNWFCWCGRCARGRAGSARIFARKRRRGHQHFPCVCLCGGSNGVRRSNFRRQFGASAAANAPAPSIWRPQLPLQNKRAFPSSRYTARMYRMQMIYLYRRMLQKS